jgi:anti-anti-sigma factor
MPVLQLSGSAVGEDVRKISEKISELADGNAATVIMDIADLESVDSNGLGAFVFSWKLLDSRDKKLLFVNPNSFIKDLLEGANLHKVFTIMDSMEGL